MGGEIEMLWDAQGRMRLIRGFLHSVIMKKTRKFKVRSGAISLVSFPGSREKK